MATTSQERRKDTRRAAANGLAISACLIAAGLPAAGQALRPVATLTPAPQIHLPGPVDSNSPAVWELDGGRQVLHVLTSVNGAPSLATGPAVARMGAATPVTFTSHPGHGVWMEAVVADVDGTWYGYYHNEIPAEVCGRLDRTVPRIGAARSTDFGLTWDDLGVILEAPPEGLVCGSPNEYFLGGVGDLSVVLDRDSAFLYVFFSQYSEGPSAQGVAVARLPWAARDAPVSQLAVWVDGAWVPARSRTFLVDDQPQLTWDYPAGTPLVAPTQAWHDRNPRVDAFWGPSVHWNSHLERYVMLLNRSSDDAFGQEGIYVAFGTSLADPSTWSTPTRIMAGGKWYPQVLGIERGTGSDKEAGARARLFLGGTSTFFIDFTLAATP